MVVRVYDQVRVALPTCDIVVATDDDRITEVLNGYGIACTLTDRCHASGTDRAAEVARMLDWGHDDIIMNVQGDEPLVPPPLLRAFAEFCWAMPELPVATVATPIVDIAHVHDSNVVKVVTDRCDQALFFSRAAILFCRDEHPHDWRPAAFLRHLGIYAYRNSLLQKLTSTAPCEIESNEKLEQLRAMWLGMPILVMRWPEAPPAGVDTPEDVARVSSLFEERMK
jgi:3-deoxy-manno-octulosonate cytidylyltransferase (CMP-KDO synthetase)